MFIFLKHYLPYLKNYKRQLFLSFLGIILVASTTALIAYMMKPLLDEVFVNKDKDMLYILPIAIVSVFLLKGIGGFLQTYYMNYVGQDIVKDVKNKTINHLLTLEISFFHSYHSGELLSRVTNDIDRIKGAVSTQLATFFREGFTALALIGVVFYHSPSLALFIFIVIPMAFYPVQIISKKLKKISHNSQESNANLNKQLNEIFSNVEIIKAYSSQKYETDKFATLNKSFFKINMKSIKTEALILPIMELFASISAGVVLIVGGMQVIDGDMSVGSFFSFLTAMFMAIDPIRRTSITYAKFQDALAANERINSILEIKPNIKEGVKKIEDIEKIEFNNVNLFYKENQALKEVNFEVKKGEIVAFVGNSGGGKSSIINLILRFFQSSSGEVLINQNKIDDFTLNSLRENISIVTQRIYIFNETIASNVAYGHKIDREKVEKALKKAHIFEYIKTLENGIDTILSEGGSTLSGGQRQRIAMARALYKEPKVLILDEATSALDNQTEKEITKTIKENSKDMITIMIAHKLKTLSIADKIFVVKKGEIICNGKEENLIENCIEFKELYKKEEK